MRIMDGRSAESPMDFEWQTRAPGDATSPFYQLSLQKQQNHSIFDSPPKSLSSLKQPSTTPFSFPQASPTRPNAVFGKPAFQTPRKFDTDYSSGAENASSPENNAAADDDMTPDAGQKKEKRNSLFNLYGRFAPSPGRGEIPKVTRHTTDQARRVHKRRVRDRDINRHLRRDSDYDVYDSDRPSSREGNERRRRDKHTQTPPSPPDPSFLIRLVAFLNDHPDLPAILSYWLQLMWNAFIFVAAVATVISFGLNVIHDIDKNADSKRSEIMAEILSCKDMYDKNRCGATDRPPALHDVCTNWERCIDQNPANVARASVSAQTISTIFSSFVDSISFKAFIFYFGTMAILGLLGNYTLAGVRNVKPQDKTPPFTAPHPSQPIPPTPSQLQQPPPYPYVPQYHQPVDYPRTPGQNDSPVFQQRNFDSKQDEPLLLDDTPSRMAFVTGRSRDREHRHTPSPTKRGRFWQ